MDARHTNQLASYESVWDKSMIFGCQCDVGWEGFDCSLRQVRHKGEGEALLECEDIKSLQVAMLSWHFQVKPTHVFTLSHNNRQASHCDTHWQAANALCTHTLHICSAFAVTTP